MSPNGDRTTEGGSLTPLLALVVVVVLVTGATSGVITDSESILVPLSASGNQAAGNAPTAMDSHATPQAITASRDAPPGRAHTTFRSESCQEKGGLAVSQQFESGMRLDMGGYTIRVPLVYVEDSEVIGFRFVSTEPIGSVMVTGDGGIDQKQTLVAGQYPDGRHVDTVWFPGVAKRDDNAGIFQVEVTTCLPARAGRRTPYATATSTPHPRETDTPREMATAGNTLTESPTPAGDQRTTPRATQTPQSPTPAADRSPTPSQTDTPSDGATVTPNSTPTRTPVSTETPADRSKRPERLPGDSNGRDTNPSKDRTSVSDGD